jgi:hypothetical protein
MNAHAETRTPTLLDLVEERFDQTADAAELDTAPIGRKPTRTLKACASG